MTIMDRASLLNVLISTLLLTTLVQSACVSDSDCGSKQVCEYGMCLPSAGLMSECSLTAQCQLEDANSICEDETCKCRLGKTAIGQPCSGKDESDLAEELVTEDLASTSYFPENSTAAFGETSTNVPGCRSHRDCSNGVGYVCAWDKVMGQRMCMPARAMYYDCRADEQCQAVVPHTRCKGYCACESDRVTNNNRTECVLLDQWTPARSRPLWIVVLPIIAALANLLLVGGGLWIFFSVRRRKRLAATRTWQAIALFQREERAKQPKSAVSEEAGPLPQKTDVYQVPAFNPDLYPQL